MESSNFDFQPSIPDNNGWNYFSKNLSSLIDNWDQGQEFQVKN